MTDREELVDLTIRYATAIDSRQYPLLTTVFTDDAELDYGEVGQWTGGGGGHRVHGGWPTPGPRTRCTG